MGNSEINDGAVRRLKHARTVRAAGAKQKEHLLRAVGARTAAISAATENTRTIV
jgi:hypothetical protein